MIIDLINIKTSYLVFFAYISLTCYNTSNYGGYMKKIVKSYIEKMYRYDGTLYSTVTTEEVKEKDPMRVIRNDYMEGFRFFDRNCILEGDNCFEGESFNYSNWIYFGKRMKLVDVISRFGKTPNYQVMINDMKHNKYYFICHTSVNTFVPLYEGDMTYEEYLTKLENERASHQKVNKID